ncbi:SAV_915 family protein [Saccharopolyspora hattusasensis]|uniref:SAV_915 family protein n=1 Tax=Saccharopolyspora hattusasensis TaxID=1128679 RepID=UPI003D95436A
MTTGTEDHLGIVPSWEKPPDEGERLAYGDRYVLRDHDDVAPSVIGAEFVAPLDGDEELPATVYLPTERVNKGDKDVTLELRDTADGDRALLAFTSVKRLVDGCGDGQPWVAVQGEQVADIKSRSGADVVLWDAALPPEERRTRFQQGD